MPECSWLHKVVIGNMAFELGRSAYEFLVEGRLFILLCLDDRRRLCAGDVVRDGTVVHDVRGAVPFGRVVDVEGSVGG